MIPLPSATLPPTERELAVLRLLGRLGAISVPTLHALLFPDRSRAVRYDTMQRLVQRGLVWKHRAPGSTRATADGKSRPVRSPGVYGLTTDGKSHIDSLQVEPQGEVFDRLIARDRRAPPPSETAMVSDLLIAAWCASVIDMVRRAPMAVGVMCQAKVAVSAGALRQTIGAVLTLVFDPQQRTYARPGWQIPWFDGEDLKDRHRVLRFALEVDNGKATTLTVRDQASIYEALVQQRVYSQVLGGNPRPVILVPPGDRGVAVARAWAEGWSNCPAILSSTVKAQHDTYGALWGTYYTVKDVPAQATTLLAGLIPSVEQWAQLTASWTPGEVA